ncbi:MAG: group II intron reverse transcriptase/maturase, partial [Candidatus Dormibacteraeota bacterium]|nr:group II intron reverse transcriptase/maturase [Candidatus Dormibacteraeota bacterium]
MNSDAPWPGLVEARERVLDHQRKLHRWASAEPERRFGDLFNLVCDRATLVVAWEQVASNRGARTAGVDAETRHAVERRGVLPFLEDLRSSLKDGSFRPLPVREATIPKKGGKVRRLGIPTLRDRVAQMALKLVLEPICEVDFYPSSYGYRPGRLAQDAIAEIHHFTSRPSNYEWVIEGDIKACFDNVDHLILMCQVEERVTDRKVLRLVKAFLRAGVVEQHGGFAASLTGTPQGGIISPLLANIYLSTLDRHFAEAWGQVMSPHHRRQQRRRKGLPNYRLVRYADDFVVLVNGTRSDAEALRDQIGQMQAERLRMTLSVEKTLVTHIDDGFDFLGFRIQRKTGIGGRSAVLTFPSKDALAAVMHKVKEATARGTTSLRLADAALERQTLHGMDRCRSGERRRTELKQRVGVASGVRVHHITDRTPVPCLRTYRTLPSGRWPDGTSAVPGRHGGGGRAKPE